MPPSGHCAALRVQRLRPGGWLTPLPGNVSGGEQLDFVGDGGLNERINWLHRLAREGAIDQETAEMHLNSFLGVKAFEGEAGRFAGMLVMPVADAPQFGNLPDLWVFVCRALTGRGDDLITGLIRQVLPCFRKPCALGEDVVGYPVLVNVVLGLVLGLYPSASRKPQFGVRGELFRRLRGVLCVGAGGFVRKHVGLVSLALMEYLARVIPLVMPAEEAFLREVYAMGHFFEHVPLVRIKAFFCFGRAL